MNIYNSTKNRVISDDVKVAQSFLSRTIGLLSRSNILDNQSLIIKPCCSVHTFFMKFPIDVLFVNSKNQIIAVYENVLPNRILPVYLTSLYVIELAAGEASNKNIEKCDIIQINER